MNRLDQIKPGQTTVNYFGGKVKSKVMYGDLTIYFSKHFNWFNRIMIRLFFGIKVENIKEDKKG